MSFFNTNHGEGSFPLFNETQLSNLYPHLTVVTRSILSTARASASSESLDPDPIGGEAEGPDHIGAGCPQYKSTRIVFGALRSTHIITLVTVISVCNR